MMWIDKLSERLACYIVKRNNKYVTVDDSRIEGVAQEIDILRALKDELIKKEQFFIDALVPSFNICRVAGNHLNFKYNDESKQKMRDSAKRRPPMSEETKIKIQNALKQAYKANPRNPPSQETRDKISKSKKGKSFHTTESRKKTAEANKVPLFQYDRQMNFIKEWDCGKEASMDLLINACNISSCARGRIKTAGNYIWIYKLNTLNR